MIYAAAALRDLGDFPGKLVAGAHRRRGERVAARLEVARRARGYIDADVCVIGEPAGVHEEWESIHLVSRGAALFKVVVLGTQMHSSISDQLPAVNATLKMAELALKMQREVRDYLTFDDHPYCRLGPTVNVGVMAQGGVTYGVFPGRAEFATDIRTVPGMTEEQVEGRRATVPRRRHGRRPRARRRRSSGTSWWAPPRSTATTRWSPRSPTHPRWCSAAGPGSTPSPGATDAAVHPGRGRRAVHRIVRARLPAAGAQPERVDAP